MLTSSDPSKPKKSFFSEWLEKLQQESWQLELLISGLALFGIWESRGMILKLEYYLDTNIVDAYVAYANALIFILHAGWAIFLINLLIHIIIRGLWIGAIGLRYVSGDIDFTQLNYSDIFKEYFLKRIGSFDDYIERLEKLSSVLFSFTFLLFFMFFSFVFVNVAFGVLFSTLKAIFYTDSTEAPQALIFFSMFFYSLGFIVLIDFFTLGGFKRVKDKTFSRIYFWIYRFFGLLSLSFIYRPLLLNFIDNRYTRRLFFLAIPYALVVLFGVRMMSLEKYAFIPSSEDVSPYGFLVDKYTVHWNNYDDLRFDYHATFSDRDRPIEKSNIVIASLNAYESSEEQGSVFLKYVRSDNDLLKRLNPDFNIFREEGVRHRIFSKGKVEDPKIEELTRDEVNEIRAMLSIVRDNGEVADSVLQKIDSSMLARIRSSTRDDIPKLRSQIERKYWDLREDHSEYRVSRALDLVLDNFRVTIDGKYYNDSLNCFFFTHPNMHEQGLLCHFPMNSLTKGDHMMYVEKKRNRGDCVDNCPYYEKYIPFRKL